jgi:hypothetical protein
VLAPSAAVANHLTPIAVHRHRQDGIVEAPAIEVEVEEGVGERVRHAVAV